MFSQSEDKDDDEEEDQDRIVDMRIVKMMIAKRSKLILYSFEGPE